MRTVLFALGAMWAGMAQAQVFADGFEVWEANVPAAWFGTQTTLSTDSVEQISDNVHSGDHAIRVRNAPVISRRLTTLPLHVDSGVTYILGYWARGYGLVRPALFDGQSYSGGLVYDTIAGNDWVWRSRQIPCIMTSDDGEFSLSFSLIAPGEQLVIDDFSVSIYQVPVPPFRSIQEIQTPLDGTDRSPWHDSIVATQGIITGKDQSSLSFFLQNGVGPYSGIWVASNAGNLYNGDEVLVYGKVQEFEEYDWQGNSTWHNGTLTRITDVYHRVVQSQNNPLPAPELLSINEAKQEEWEGVLVRLEGIRWPGGINFPEGWYGVANGDSIRVHDMIYAVLPDTNYTYSMNGVMHYWRNWRRFQPRGPMDVQAVGVPEGELAGLRLYPNPATDLIRVEWHEPLLNTDYAIHDAMGRVVQSGRLLNDWIALEGTDAGLRMLQIRLGDGRVVRTWFVRARLGIPGG